jgi:hypothetical protein
VNDIEPPTGTIKLWTRLGAGFLLLVFLTFAILIIRDYLPGSSLAPTTPWYKVALVIPALILFAPYLASVAFRGRAPKYWLDMERRTREARARAGERPRSISALWYWTPRSPRWLRRTCLMLLALIAVGHSVAITLNAITRGISGRQLGLLIFVWFLAAVVIVLVLRWWRSPSWNDDGKTE